MANKGMCVGVSSEAEPVVCLNGSQTQGNSR